MAEELLINSDQSLETTIEKFKSWYEKHHYLTLKAVLGVTRSLNQNRMFQELYGHVGEQIYGGDKEYARRQCKFDIGVPILRNDDDDWDNFYGMLLDHLTYEQKVEAMKIVNVSSEMSTPQASIYINRILDYYSLAGVGWPDYLTDKAKKFEEKANKETIELENAA